MDFSASRQPALEQSIAEKGKQKGSRRSSAKYGAYGRDRYCVTVASEDRSLALTARLQG